MPQLSILRTSRGFYVYDFVHGIKPAKFKRRWRQDDILALALWLEQRGRTEEAEHLIEQHCTVMRDS